MANPNIKTMATYDDVHATVTGFILNGVVNGYEKFKASRNGSCVLLDKSELCRLVGSSIAIYVKFSYDQKLVIATRFQIKENNLHGVQLEGESDQSLPRYCIFNIDKIHDLELLV